ncbi:hypothetical protein BJ508DRAFT_330746 [Ascobolus immersus RN42]|uniref:Uncharacterized protein n=1 Tax=Ascobolus immersus RN42 TaxID=1160509 RepID=A0A3N4HYD0_ASCIM|nr:hypothetical protein BJ508DRAFT_330746 [Ascobolus immersus RN42]
MPALERDEDEGVEHLPPQKRPKLHHDDGEGTEASSSKPGYVFDGIGEFVGFALAILVTTLWDTDWVLERRDKSRDELLLLEGPHPKN